MKAKIAQLFNNHWEDIVPEFDKVHPNDLEPIWKDYFQCGGCTKDDIQVRNISLGVLQYTRRRLVFKTGQPG